MEGIFEGCQVFVLIFSLILNSIGYENLQLTSTNTTATLL